MGKCFHHYYQINQILLRLRIKKFYKIKVIYVENYFKEKHWRGL